MIIGYCRISTKEQSIERQIRNIQREYPQAVIRTEVFTGTVSDDRKEWQKIKRAVKEGDTIVFDSVSRMSRNAEIGFEEYQELFGRGVSLMFIKEPHINTDVYRTALSNSIAMTGTNADIILRAINEYLMAVAKEQIRLAFEQAEKEVMDLRQRTREGMVTARLNGKQIGRKEGSVVPTKKALNAKEVIRKHSKDFGGTLADQDVRILAGVSRNSYYKYKREIREELGLE